jgi:hypothetical protein
MADFSAKRKPPQNVVANQYDTDKLNQPSNPYVGMFRI